ncbi:MAG: SDR family NAD(P)-dependent oxidoreductase [Sphingomonadales bacterium]|nr:SDR family NAD(P)-dependent oxidoreductase [Sphingomonadales bacterium]
MRLENRKAIITGAAQGMGGTITRTLAGEGADVFLTARTLEPLQKVAAEIRAMGRKAEVATGDVTKEKDVESIVAAAKSFFGGRIDILVNAAGATDPIETPVWGNRCRGLRGIAAQERRWIVSPDQATRCLR